MNLITPTELARRCDISKQAAFDAIIKGVIPFTLSGTKKMIDLDNPAIQLYITDNNRQREAVKKNEINSSQQTEQKAAEMNKPSKQREKKNAKQKKPSKQQNGNKVDNGNRAELENYDVMEWNARKKIAETKIKEFQADAQNKDLAPMEVIDSIHFRYLERFNSNMERLASVYIGEVGKEILEAGEVLPAHIEKFLSHILNAIHDNKLAVAKEFKKYDPKL